MEAPVSFKRPRQKNIRRRESSDEEEEEAAPVWVAVASVSKKYYIRISRSFNFNDFFLEASVCPDESR